MWISLGDMSKTSAMEEFVKMLETLCPQFTPYVQAKRAEREEQQRKQYVLKFMLFSENNL